LLRWGWVGAIPELALWGKVFYNLESRILFVAVVAQLVEHRIVIPVVAGSSPVDRPNFLSLGWGERNFS
jgi:hypothetical protein